MDATLSRQIPNIAALCEQYGVAHLELFGSATGTGFNPESSDVDFLVELDPKISGSRARRWTELADALETLLGRHVDLVNPQYIRNPYFLQAVNSSRTSFMTDTKRTPKLLIDALGAIVSAREFMARCSLDVYIADKMRRSAVERQLEILGEACSRLAKLEPSLIESVANLKLAIDLRTRIIHGYDSVDDEIVYLTVTGDLKANGTYFSRLPFDGGRKCLNLNAKRGG